MGEQTAATPRLRDMLGRLPAYAAGRPPSGAAHLTPYKLSSNENHHAPLPGVLDAIAEAALGMNRYPDPASTRLVAELAARHGVPEDHVALGTGSVGLLQQIVQVSADAGDEVLYAWRSFEAYPIMTTIAGAVPVQVPLAPGALHDLDAMADAITDRTRCVFVCTPNNPTGTVVHQADLDRFLDRVPRDVLVVVDEAYVEFVRDPDAVRGIETYRDRENVAVLRTFSKAYGLAGLRVGFAIAHPRVALALRKTAVPFGVSTLAQAAAIASLHAEDALLERVEAIVAERTRVEAALADQGFDLPPSQANFVWLPLGDRIAEFVDACEQVNLSVRRYADDGVRVTIGEREANDRFLGVSAGFAPAG
ncbi:MAG TPA: histidinol-phosphate transaminase [Candidatus Nanopelagicales bacterium]|nr:histidinol-phosphate transaminase [Candidatus Nanopelagicales bacterium]